MARVTIEDALEYCLANPDGLSAEELLTRFPEYREELQPLLALSLQVETTAPPPVPVDRRAAMKARLMDAAAAQGRAAQATQANPQQAVERVVVRAKEPNWIWAALRRPVLVAGSFVAVLVALLWWGAAGALPDSPLYGVKLASENLLLNFAGDAGNRATTHLGLANSRLSDIETMSRQKNLAGIDGAVGNYNYHMNSSTTLWKETTGQVQQVIKQSIGDTINRCVEDFKSFGGDIAQLPEPVRANVQRLYSDLSTIRVEIGESPDIEGPQGITFNMAPTSTPGNGTPTVTAEVTSVPTRAATVQAVTATSEAPKTETVVVDSTVTSVVRVTSTGLPTGGARATPIRTGTQVATARPTANLSSGPSPGTAIVGSTETPRAVNTASPAGTRPASPTKLATSVAIASATGAWTSTSTSIVIVSTPIVGATSIGTSIPISTATGTSLVIPASTLPALATKTSIPTIVAPPTIYIPPIITPVVPTPAPPKTTAPPTITIIVVRTNSAVPELPTSVREPTSEEKCNLHVNNMQVLSSCAVGGDVSWTANVVNMSATAQNGNWDAVLLVKGRTGGYIEVGSGSGSGTFLPNHATPIQGNFSNVITANVKSLKVELTIQANGLPCEEASAKEKACQN